MKQNIFLIFLILFSGSLFAQDCTRNSDKTVTCSKSGLMWQDDEDVAKVNFKIWEDAIKYCENLDLAGYKDWRLPNIKELKSITSRLTKVSPIIKDGFKNLSDDRYWSSTVYIVDKNSAWVLGFKDIFDIHEYKGEHLSVRCVR